MTLYDFVREHGCYSVKCGCETSNCGLCTVFLNDKPVLSCSVLAVRADKCSVTTLEGLQDEADNSVSLLLVKLVGLFNTFYSLIILYIKHKNSSF
jgi:aerobic carbon-monoxide dehydrogenase small subunit